MDSMPLARVAVHTTVFPKSHGTVNAGRRLRRDYGRVTVGTFVGEPPILAASLTATVTVLVVAGSWGRSIARSSPRAIASPKNILLAWLRIFQSRQRVS